MPTGYCHIHRRAYNGLECALCDVERQAKASNVQKVQIANSTPTLSDKERAVVEAAKAWAVQARIPRHERANGRDVCVALEEAVRALSPEAKRPEEVEPCWFKFSDGRYGMGCTAVRMMVAGPCGKRAWVSSGGNLKTFAPDDMIIPLGGE